MSEPTVEEAAIYDVLRKEARNLPPERSIEYSLVPFAIALDKAFITIPRADLPAATVIDRDGVPHISVEGAEAGTWKAAGNHVQARKWGLEYLAAAQAMEAWQARQAAAAEKLRERRDELVSDIVGHGWTYGPNVTSGIRRAVDRIIELENK